MLSSPGDPTPACSEREAEKSKCVAPAAGEGGSLHTRDLGTAPPVSAVEACGRRGSARGLTGAVRQPCEDGGQVHTAPGRQRSSENAGNPGAGREPGGAGPPLTGSKVLLGLDSLPDEPSALQSPQRPWASLLLGRSLPTCGFRPRVSSRACLLPARTEGPVSAGAGDPWAAAAADCLLPPFSGCPRAPAPTSPSLSSPG